MCRWTDSCILAYEYCGGCGGEEEEVLDASRTVVYLGSRVVEDALVEDL
jgi:hypothetical protein